MRITGCTKVDIELALEETNKLYNGKLVLFSCIDFFYDSLMVQLGFSPEVRGMKWEELSQLHGIVYFDERLQSIIRRGTVCPHVWNNFIVNLYDISDGNATIHFNLRFVAGLSGEAETLFDAKVALHSMLDEFIQKENMTCTCNPKFELKKHIAFFNEDFFESKS